MRIAHRLGERRVRLGRLALRLLVGLDPRELRARIHRGLLLRHGRRAQCGAGTGDRALDRSGLHYLRGRHQHLRVAVAVGMVTVAGERSAVSAVAVRRGDRLELRDRLRRARRDHRQAAATATRGHRCARHRWRVLGTLRVRRRQRRGATLGRVRLVVVRAVEHQLHLRLRTRARIDHRFERRPERTELHRQTARREARETVLERAEICRALLVERDRAMRTIAEDLADQAREHRARADLDERAHARRVHRLDLLDEAHRLRELLREDLARFLAALRVRLGRRARDDVALRQTERDALEELRERRGRIAHHARVEGRRDVEPLERDPLGRELLLDRLDRIRRAAEHGLIGRVVVGDDDARVLDLRSERARPEDHRGHRAVRALAGIAHQLAALARDREHVLVPDRARRAERHHFAEAVTGDRRRDEADRIHQAQERERRRAEAGLGPFGRRHLRLLQLLGVHVERGMREHHVADRRAVVLAVLSEIEGRARGVPRHRDGAAHADVLRALAREHEADLALVRAHLEVEPVRHREGLAGADLVGRHAQLRGEIRIVRRHDRAARARARIEAFLRVTREEAQHARRVFLDVLGRLLDLGGQRLQLGAQRLGVRGRDEHDLAALRARARRGLGRPRVLLDREVEVRAAEAEARDTRATRMIAAADPRARLRRQIEGALLDLHLRVRRRHLDRRRDDLVVNGHDRLDEARRAGGALGVPDLGLHRAERAPIALRLACLVGGLVEHDVEAFDLGRIARLRARAVRLDELDRVGPVARDRVRATHGLGLTLRQRRVDAERLAVRRRADALDDRVHAIARTLGIAQPLERDHAEAFAQHRAVGIGAERAAVARRRERRRLAEAHVHEDVVHRVAAACDDEIRLADHELVDRHVHGAERGRARRVGDAVGAADVETVRDAACDDVAEQTGEVRFFPLRVARAHAITRGLHLALGHADFAQGLHPDRALQARDHRAHQLLAARHAEDAADARAIDARELSARRVVEHLLGDDEREQLRRVRLRDDARRDAPLHRIEGDVVQERAALGVRLVRTRHVRVVVVADQPVRLGDLFEQIFACEDVLPEAGLVDRSGEQRRHAHDRDRLEPGLLNGRR